MKRVLSIDELVSRGIEQILPSADGLAKLIGQKKIRVYLGIDPTGNQLHLGHAVVLRKLQQFADLGHEVILLIGNGTVKIGDPTGRDKTRPVLTDEQIEAHFQSWKEQASKILDFSKVQIRHNGDWLDALKLPDVIKLLSHSTVQQLMERDMFQERMKAGLPIFTHELIYPLLQGFDSVAMDVDLELGGNDQLFNMMMGRQLQRDINNREKFVLTVPLLVGSDGRKMGKSFGNFIGLTESPEDMFGKLMSIVDDIILTYFTLLTDISAEELEQLSKDLASGTLHPMEAKKRLAHLITSQYHSEAAALSAQENFERTVQKKELPKVMPSVPNPAGGTSVLTFVMSTGILPSNSEGRRLIEQGAVTLNDEKLADPNKVVSTAPGQVLKIGKRQYFRVK